MARKDSKNKLFSQRIPVDVYGKAVGLKLTIPLGDGEVRTVTITPKAQAVRFSLRTDDPAKVKAWNAAAAGHLEKVWQALRQDNPAKLTNEQATALAGRLYRAWAKGERGERTFAVEQGPDGKMHIVEHDPQDDEDIFTAALARLVRPLWHGQVMDLDPLPPPEDRPEATDLEAALGPLVDRLLFAEGIGRVDLPSRGLLLLAFWRALRDALETRLRNAKGDYSPDPMSERFPSWRSPLEEANGKPFATDSSLTSLVEGWWKEAKATGLKDSTYESYSGTMRALVAFLGHDDAGRVTDDDILRFKDHRLSTINPRTGRNLTAKTVKDSDLAGLKAVFRWSVDNKRIQTNPAKNVTIKLPKRKKLRGAKTFTDEEAAAILKATLKVERGQMLPETYAAKRWVPWLMAYSGARVGEVAQLRKQDLHQSKGGHWYIIITPEAGTVKTDEERVVVLHPHIVEQGFADFVKASRGGHLFLRPDEKGDVLGPLGGVKNRLQEFVREVVPRKSVAPNHGWRHTFSAKGTEAGIEDSLLDMIGGWAGQNVRARIYTEATIKAQAEAMKKFPRYDLEGT